MRILQINTIVNSGSTGRIAEDIGKVAMAEGHESYIAYGRGDRPSASELIKIGTDLDVYGHVALTLLLDKHGFGSKKATRKFIKEIEAIKPDVIGLHNIHGYYLNIELLFNYLAKKEIPVIWTLHDSWAYTGHCTFYESVDCEKWQTHCHNCPKTQQYPKSLWVDNSRANYTSKKYLFNLPENVRLVTPSEWLAGEVRQSYLKHPVECIYNGVDLEVFTPNGSIPVKYAEVVLGKKIVLGVASTWDARKGMDDFVKLSSMLPENFRIVLIGLSEKQIKEIPDSILGIARTENVEELAAWYGGADVFVNPTYQDNFPTTNIEALACGTPVITYRTGGSPEAVDENTGRTVEKGNLAMLQQAIEAIVLEDREAFRIYCRARAEEHFDKEKRYSDYLSIYEELVKE
ncbi:glycosyltransferase [Flavobacterium sp. MFBS3-15]|uniref:glycosyltransferase n=1 Tax=Flavobacterium sp. MFBS3-15 TaxID=2989816 RepID=UPI00223664E0|nr:glycosyltransferase [Flavobacterium sp. MFBS3-15]MCW4469575.1 glycosyltransferase [Flavobacterium sp. MFBS3-15]